MQTYFPTRLLAKKAQRNTQKNTKSKSYIKKYTDKIKEGQIPTGTNTEKQIFKLTSNKKHTKTHLPQKNPKRNKNTGTNNKRKKPTCRSMKAHIKTQQTWEDKL